MFFLAPGGYFRGVIPQTVLEGLLAGINLPELIGEKVALAKRAGVHEGLCPFHKEQTPSFKVFHDHYHCFGCGAHGNAIEFVMHSHGLSFPAAVELLAGITGMPLPGKGRRKAVADPQARGIDALRRACARYHQILFAEAGKEAMQALSDRGVDDETLIRFGVGYAPASWGTLSDDKEFRRDALVTAGLGVQRGEKRGCYDFFRDRIVFPVRSDNGDVIGFGGRRLGHEGPKYLNTPETACYQKGRVLFGLPQALSAIRKTGSVIVCEGFFDVMIPSQAGIEQVVSTCGTALTDAQAQIILSLADKIFLCFDGDAAGAKATWRTAEMLVPLAGDHHEIRLCRLPDGEDPDSLVRTSGGDALLAALDASPTLCAYLVGEITRGARLPEAKTRALSVAASLFRQFSAQGLATFFHQYACENLGLPIEEFERLVAEAPRRDGESSLRACPFCAGGATMKPAGAGVQVACLNCGASTPAVLDENECRNQWNRRERPRIRTTSTSQ